MDNGRRICWSPGPLSSAASPAGRIPASAQGYPRCCPAGPVAQRRGTRSKDEGHNRVALRWAAGSPCSSCFRWRAMESDRSPIVIDSDPADPNKQFRKFQGAGPVAGEVTDIAVDPQGTEDQIIYISTNDGGIWKSTDGGTTWNPKTDGMPSLSMGAVAIDPRILRLSMPEPATSLTVEECSRKAWASIHLPTPERPGPFGGAVLTNKAVTDIALPASNVLLVATNAGLFRSVDGGENFGNNAPQFNNSSPVLNGSISSLNWIWHRQPPFMPECAARDYSSRRMRVQLFPPTCLPTLEDPPALSTTSRSASLLGQIPTCSPVSRIQPSLRLIKVFSSRQTAALLGQ